MNELTLVRGDDRDLALVAGVDLTGAKVWFTARYRRSDTAAVFAKTSDALGGIVITSAAAGLATVYIAAADWAAYSGTAPLVWDVQVLSAAGKVTTPVQGTIRVEQDVTRTVT